MLNAPINRFGHVDIRVTSLATALPFYSDVMPVLGFGRTFHSTEWKVFVAEGTFPSAPFVGITEDPNHRPNHNRIAFWASSRDEVERLAEVVRRAGGKITSGPQLYPEYRGAYFAVFFEDPSGNRLEIVHRTI
jgi:catechol 2,3-dioxygenase-like lactoylglutathione lyase family enzyme